MTREEGGKEREEHRRQIATSSFGAKMDASSLCIKATRTQKKTLTHQ